MKELDCTKPIDQSVIDAVATGNDTNKYSGNRQEINEEYLLMASTKLNVTSQKLKKIVTIG